MIHHLLAHAGDGRNLLIAASGFQEIVDRVLAQAVARILRVADLRQYPLKFVAQVVELPWPAGL